MKGIEDALAEVAGIAQRLAVLLAAGVTPERAWEFLEDPRPGSFHDAPIGRHSTIVSAAAAAAVRADDVAAAISAECANAPPRAADRQLAVAWGLFAAVWEVAVRSGAPLAGSLQDFASGIRHAAGLHRELGVAFAGPRATARLVGLLPLVALAFGLLLGVDTVHVLVATPIGWVCVALGIALMVVARRWSGRLLTAAEPLELVPGLVPELVATAMRSGVSVDRARRLTAEALAANAPFLSGAALETEVRAVDSVLELATRAGVPTIGLLHAEAVRRRAHADAAGRAAAASVAVRLVVPLAVCVLPAFMLLGVVPVLVALFAGTGIRFE